jgi:hypothetical protein
MTMKRTPSFSVLLLLCALPLITFGQDIHDELTLGNTTSETAHQLTAKSSKVIPGALGQTARVILPIGNYWKGGEIFFVLKIDPEKQNYITVKFWGSDINEDMLILFCEGKQVGYRHLGDIDILDHGAENPVYNERFTYNTIPLPLNQTRGKTEITLSIQASGRIWGYGTTFDKYQYAMREPSRGIYNIYSHTNGCFTPPANEKQGLVPSGQSVLKQKGDDSFTALKQRVNKTIDGLVKSNKPLNQVQMQFLAKAYQVKWTYAYHNGKVIARLEDGLDNSYFSFVKNPKLAQSEPSTPNPDWFGLGISGQVVHLIFDQLKGDIDKPLGDEAGVKLSRRDAYTEMLLASREYHRSHRRQYSNQSMINDLYGIYYANKGIEDLRPEKALSEHDVRQYLYQSVGLQPWLGSETDHGPSRSAGDNYMQLTAMGLTKELGYVGYYGEVIDWATEIYDATRPAPGQPGDERIKSQLEKIALARSYFRYPALDSAGNRAMRIETIIGWRDVHFPGGVTYAQRATWDGSVLQVAAATLNPSLLGYVQQMMADNQYFSTVENEMADKGFRQTAGLLPVPDQYQFIIKQPLTGKVLPMSWSQPDLVFADPEDGVIAIKNGKEILYASLYWRARNAINFLAKVHYLIPQLERTAVVREEEEFEPSGLTYTRPDWVNFGFANGGLKYPEEMHSALAGEKLPIAKIPAEIAFKPGQENPYAGRASFYKLEYGKYLIGMNADKDKPHVMAVPAGFENAIELVSRKKIGGKTSISVPPSSTVVLFADRAK